MKLLKQLLQPKLKYMLLHENAYKPERGTNKSSGLDVFTPFDITIKANTDVVIPLGLRVKIPFGYDLTVNNKSGIATKKKLIKGAELIDNDYRGDIKIHLYNFSSQDVKFQRGEKIAQLVMRPVWIGKLKQEKYIPENTQRGSGGFGSTGK